MRAYEKLTAYTRAVFGGSFGEFVSGEFSRRLASPDARWAFAKVKLVVELES